MDSPPKLDLLQFGRLIQAVETLTKEVSALNSRVAVLESQLTGGKGVIIGLMIAAGGLGAFVSEAVKTFFKS